MVRKEGVCCTFVVSYILFQTGQIIANMHHVEKAWIYSYRGIGRNGWQRLALFVVFGAC